MSPPLCLQRRFFFGMETACRAGRKEGMEAGLASWNRGHAVDFLFISDPVCSQVSCE